MTKHLRNSLNKVDYFRSPRSVISAILAYFGLDLVAMTTPFASLKILIAYLISPTLKSLPYMQKCLDIWY